MHNWVGLRAPLIQLRMASMLALGVGTLAGCSRLEPGPRTTDTALVDLELRSVQPGVVLPTSRLVVEGDSFVDNPWGTSFLQFEGVMITDSEESTIRARFQAEFVDFEQLQVELTQQTFGEFGSVPARFEGIAAVEVESAVDGRTYRSSAVNAEFEVRQTLTPQLEVATDSLVVFPNDPIEVVGSGLLLEEEGESVAIVEGCFAIASGECRDVGTSELVVEPGEAGGRDGGFFMFAPRIAGIQPGRFEGSVRIENRHRTGEVLSNEARPVVYDLVEPALFGIDTQVASLGRYLTISGAGFVGNGEGSTALQFVGSFTPRADGIPIEVDELLIPEFVGGRTVRYVVNEDDGISNLLNVRFDAGTFAGLVTPQIAYQDQRVDGPTVPFSFELEPVRQVVWVRFLPAYKESLRAFGLRAVDGLVRERVFEVIRRDFATLNVEIREEEPADYFLYAQVDISGPDPNGLGLLGYDNTPGKDTRNERLYDRIGGVNAITQDDGFPGFGGVFIESLFGYSSDPAGFAEPLRVEEQFDQIFDPFRSDRGGSPVAAADLTGDVPDIDTNDCPTQTGDRAVQLACAIYTLGNLVGTTVTHEIGHSLGLADPYGPTFHNQGDRENRMMDADRPFEERAELGGFGPSVFCVEEYEYLREVLPTTEPYDITPRPPCY